MKPYQRYTSLFAAAALALSGSLQAQQQGSSGSSTTPSSSSDSMSQPGAMSSSSTALGDISRVTKDAVKNQFTAKDLIGAAVYDPAGEKIGDVTDIALAGSHAQQLGAAFSAAQNEMDAADDAPATTYPSTLGNAATSPTTGTSAVGGDRSSTMETAGNTSSDTSGNLSRTGSGAREGSSVGAAASGLYSSLTGQDQNETRVFISVGGLMGIGDDLVSVPVSHLSYNTTEERFELSASKADVVALAEQRDDATYASSGSSMSDPATSAGKQEFSDEATKVQNALETNPGTSSFAYKVSVTTDGQSIELHGTVDNEDQHEKILEAAREATSHDVEDKLQVRE